MTGDGFVELALVAEDDPEVVAGLGEIGLQQHGLPIWVLAS